MGCCCSQAHKNFRPDCLYLGLQPEPASSYLFGVWLLVYTALAAWLKFEMLYSVGDIDHFAIDVGLLECDIQNTPGGSYKRMPVEILLVAGLFTHKDDPRALRSFPEDSLRCALPQMATPASCSS